MNDYIEVESDRIRGLFYRVYFDPSGILRCNCPAGSHDRNCKHKSKPQVLQWIRKIQIQKQQS